MLPFPSLPPIVAPPHWSPLAIGAGGWFDASDLSTIRQDRGGASATIPAVVNGFMGSWRNKGLQGGWATAPSDVARPILRAGGGLYWLEFDGVDDYLFHPDIVSYNPGVWYSGLRQISASGPQFYTAISNIQFQLLIGGNQNIGAGAMIGYAETAPVGPFVHTALFDAATSAQRKNGVQQGGTANAGANTGSVGLYIGTNSSSATVFGEMDLYQYFTAPTFDVQAEQFIAEKCGVTL